MLLIILLACTGAAVHAGSDPSDGKLLLKRNTTGVFDASEMGAVPPQARRVSQLPEATDCPNMPSISGLQAQLQSSELPCLITTWSDVEESQEDMLAGRQYVPGFVTLTLSFAPSVTFIGVCSSPDGVSCLLLLTDHTL